MLLKMKIIKLATFLALFNPKKVTKRKIPGIININCLVSIIFNIILKGILVKNKVPKKLE